MKIDLINSEARRPSPFRVPEGYFEQFSAEMMQQLPPRVSLFTRIKPYIYLAATICGLAFGIKVFKYQQQYYGNSTNVYASVTDDQAAQFVDDVCDFTMVSASDVFAFATDND